MAQPTAQDLIDALDRLTRATLAASDRKSGPTVRKDVQSAPDIPDWMARAEHVYQNSAQYKAAAQELSSGHMSDTIRGLRRSYQLYKGASTAVEASAGDEALAQLAAQGGRAAAAASEGAGTGAAAAGGTLAGVGAVAAPIAAVVAATLALVVAFRAFKNHVVGATDELIHTQDRLSEVSGSMAAVFAERELAEMQRDRDKGDRLSRSAGYLARGEQYRKNVDAEWEVLTTRVQNWAEGWGNRLVGKMQASIIAIPILNRLADWLEDKLGADEPKGVAAWLERVEEHEKQRLQDGKDGRGRVAENRERANRL